MLVYLIFTFCVLLTLFIVFGFYKGCAKPNGHLVLTVNLPAHILTHNLVTEITDKYKKSCNYLFFALLLTGAAFYFIRNYTSISAMLLLIYCILVVAGYCILLEHYRKKLLALKKQQNWIISKTKTISIDTEVSRLKNTFPVSRKHFVLPVLINALVLLIYWFFERETLLFNIIPALTIPFIIACGIIMYEIFARMPSKFYCENSEANIALNKCYKRECSKVCICFIYSSLAMLPVVIYRPTDSSYTIMVLISAFFTVAIMLISVLSAYYKVRRERNKFISLIEKNIEIDDDEYWHYGFYYNPYDKKTFVEPRVGFGLEVNYARPAGKVFIIIIAAVFISIFGIFTAMLPLDFIESFKLEQSGGKFSINAPLYSDTFDKDDIVSVEKLTEIKNAVRTNGASSSSYALGNYIVDGYGKSRLYITKNIGLYVVIRLESGTNIIINGASLAETEKFYNMLTE